MALDLYRRCNVLAGGPVNSLRGKTGRRVFLDELDGNTLQKSENEV